jgi:arabinogalactan oligomer / maltooligosaccharide transport system permease protein
MSVSTKEKKSKKKGLDDGGSPSLLGTIVKITLLGILAAGMLFAIMILIGSGSYLVAGVATLATLFILFIYLRRGMLPAKYMIPGLIFMMIFQVYVALYSGYIAFTNYGGGHIGSKDGAISIMSLTGQERVPDSPELAIKVLQGGDDIGLLALVPQDDGAKIWEFGNAESTLSPDRVSGTLEEPTVAGYRELNFSEIVANQDALIELKVPAGDEYPSAYVLTKDGSFAYFYQPTLAYDPDTDVVTRVTDGVKFFDNGEGNFQSVTGEKLNPGWRAEIGFANFERAFTEERIRGPFLGVVIWTFSFAILTVIVTFAMGLGLALLFNDKTFRGRKFYRVAMILPYAFPGFLSAMIWRSMFNEKYGFINQVILGGIDIPWLSDQWLAKLAILFVNFWLGFPYMFLIVLGALQAIPDELMESAKIDGATPWQQLRLIKLPLLLVSVAPLLVTSFAFNFNNFTLIFLLTGGGPKNIEAGLNAGHTDILITLVYKLAFNAGEGSDFGLASAFSILIFFVVGTISYLGFRRSRTLEDMN